MDKQTHNPYYAAACAQLSQAGASLRAALEQDPHLCDRLTALERGALVLALGERVAMGVLNRARQAADDEDRQEREAERLNRDDSQIKRRSFQMQEYVARPTDEADDDDRITGVIETTKRSY